MILQFNENKKIALLEEAGMNLKNVATHALNIGEFKIDGWRRWLPTI